MVGVLLAPRGRMKIRLLSDESIRLENDNGPMTVEAESAAQQYTPFHMMASGLALCTYNVVHSWATHAKLDAADLVVEVSWTFAEKPHRIGSYAMRFIWPSVPEARRESVLRAARLCPVHATFGHPPEIRMEVA